MPAPRSAWVLRALLLWSAVPLIAGMARLVSLLLGRPLSAGDSRFFAAPWPVVVHIAGSAVFCVLGAWQLTTASRGPVPARHRWHGGWLVLCGVLAAASGLWMTLAYPIPPALQGPTLFWVRLAVGIGMLAALLRGLHQARHRHHRAHAAWMLRAYALGQGAGTQVLLLLPVSLLAGMPPPPWRDALMTLAWIINLALAEAWVQYRAQPRGARGPACRLGDNRAGDGQPVR